MLFNNSQTNFESEKERNLYYKVFAGFLFNELIDGYSERIKKIIELFDHSSIVGRKAIDFSVESIDTSDLHVSFDNHLYLFSDITADRGEFADILIHSKRSNVIFTIEAKLNSNFTFSKDILQNQKRINTIHQKLDTVKIIPILLLRKSKWLEKYHTGSNHYKFLHFKENQFRVIFWEDILEIIGQFDKKVHNYLKQQLARNNKKSKYIIKDNWLVHE
jgi:hypothetical protein